MNNPTDPANPKPEPPPIPAVQPLGTNPAEILDSLLKRPASLMQELTLSKNPRFCVTLALAALAGFTAYGILIGTFSGGGQLLAAPVKVAGCMLLSALICFPSLYIFVSLSGVEISLRGVAGILFATLALTGVLLLGFAPVAWVFSQSTQSVVFIGALYLIIWGIATALGLRLLGMAVRPKRSSDDLHIAVWKMVFILVSLQMTTALRPIVGVSKHWLPGEKKFFLSYWQENVFGNEPSTGVE